MAKDDKQTTMNEQALTAAADKAADKAADRARQEAAQRALVVQLQAALAPLAAISPRGEQQATLPADHGGPAETQFSGVYQINRCQQRATLTAAELEFAHRVAGDPQASAADLRKALGPLARLPLDFTIGDAARPLYSFPARQAGPPVGITNGMIRAAQEARAALED